VNFTTRDITATAGFDYTYTAGSLVITRENWNAPSSIAVPILPDRRFEGDEAFAIDILAPLPSGLLLDTNASSSSVTIKNTLVSGEGMGQSRACFLRGMFEKQPPLPPCVLYTSCNHMKCCCNFTYQPDVS
jgi:hypothetical protein